MHANEVHPDAFDESVHRMEPKYAIRTLERAPENIESLMIWFCGIKDFSILGRFPNLRHLRIADWRATSFADLAQAPRLRTLYVFGGTAVTDLSGLHNLDALEWAEIHPSTAQFSKRKYFVASFAPLEGLQALRHLTISYIPEDGSLDVFSRMPSLTKLTLRADLPLSHWAQLNVLRPDLDSGPLMPLADEVTPEFENGELAWDRCKKCHAQQVFLRGIVKGRTIFCPSCHKKRIARHVEWFEELRDRYLSHAHDSET